MVHVHRCELMCKCSAHVAPAAPNQIMSSGVALKSPLAVPLAEPEGYG